MVAVACRLIMNGVLPGVCAGGNGVGIILAVKAENKRAALRAAARNKLLFICRIGKLPGNRLGYLRNIRLLHCKDYIRTPGMLFAVIALNAGPVVIIIIMRMHNYRITVPVRVIDIGNNAAVNPFKIFGQLNIRQLDAVCEILRIKLFDHRRVRDHQVYQRPRLCYSHA